MSIIDMKAVKSSNIASIGYDEASKTMAIKFNSGGLYHYRGVSPEQHTALVSSPSVGSHFFAHVKGKFDFVKQEEKKDGGK
jgi:hypothetical protein